jgi:hypothetical protein
MLVLAVAYAYYGLLQTFSNGILTTAISFTNNYGANMINTLVGLNAVAQGVGSLIGVDTTMKNNLQVRPKF